MDKAKELEVLILKHRAFYYQGRSQISDYEYDELEEKLRVLSPESYVFKMVGATVSSIDKVRHDSKMLSLSKTYIKKDLEEWMGKDEIISTFKLDGVSCSLIYENGKLIIAKTRGDGSFGENITSKVLWMSSIPKEIVDNRFIEIRGELFCREIDFFNLSNEMEEMNKERPSSQRNIVAGLISRKEGLEFCRYLSFKAFDLLEIDRSSQFYDQRLIFLNKQGFDVPEFIIHKDGTSLDEVINTAEEFMSSGDYLIDGLVFSINDVLKWEDMGETAHHPRYKKAFKFKGESKQTKIKKIEWSVSRNGVLTPVGIVEKVELSGAQISRVTLHNFGMVKQYNLKQGDEIEIIRSGEVIPKFLSVISSSDNAFEIPKRCPTCESGVLEVDIRLFCSNELCPDRVKEGILNFVQKIGIYDLNNKRIEEMIKKGLIKGIADLFKIKKDDLLGLDKTKEKLAQKIYESIQKVKVVDLVTLLSSLGIRGGAFNKCEKVVNAGYDSFEKLKIMSAEDLCFIDSFAEKSSREFIGSLKDKICLLEELFILGIKIKRSTSTQILKDKRICITGALSEKRSIIEKKIRDAGGVTVSSVSKKTDYLLTNETDSNSSKFKKAKDLNVLIISELGLEEILNKGHQS